jgi:hypothetical protein
MDQWCCRNRHNIERKPGPMVTPRGVVMAIITITLALAIVDLPARLQEIVVP